MDSFPFCSRTIHQGLTDRVQMNLAHAGAESDHLLRKRNPLGSLKTLLAVVYCDEARGSSFAAPNRIIDRLPLRERFRRLRGSVDPQIRRTWCDKAREYRSPRVPHHLRSRPAHSPSFSHSDAPAAWLAVATDHTLLFKGDDFIHTDIRPALPAAPEAT